MNIDKNDLIKELYNYLNKATIERHSLTTHEWSKGYRKAILDIINSIENNKETTIHL